ncbi:MAG: hypothetical protein A2142_07165 [candidate division Zixibacteria bacterium RBG_16_48_11]|nr:MAG: hypothetical protein A2142_07165 [candidate division Zixibacteria bacterium RBG_16_48_11]
MKHTQGKYNLLLKRYTNELGNKLQLGSGRMPLPSFLNVDFANLPGVDLVADLEKKLPFQDNRFDLVLARHTVEHVENLQQLMEELHRITKPTGRIELEVPHPSYIFTFRDPTHKHFFTLHSFDYYQSGYDFDYYMQVKFRILDRRVEFTGGRFKILNLFSHLVNLSHFTQDLWERFCWLLPMENLFFSLQPIKKQ